jgi:ADP-ribose pyrophosphatase YjhB (NUDIX family)
MQKQPFKISSYVALILKNENNILLIRRFQTGIDDGCYGCAGGKINGNEPITQALIREAYEELGIILKKEHLKVVHVLHRKHKQGYEVIGFYILATTWEGNPQNMEPHKCDDIIWVDVATLPENTQPHFKHVIKMLQNNIFFSEFGWE